MSTESPESEYSLTDTDYRTSNSLQALKHAVDVYSHPAKATNSKTIHSRLPYELDAEYLRSAIQYAEERSHALDDEVQQLRRRAAELPALDSEGPGMEIERPVLRSTKLCLDGMNEKQLRNGLVEVILERRAKAKEMDDLMRTVIHRVRKGDRPALLI